jgi:hypothetical protein
MPSADDIEIALKALNSLHENSDHAIMQALACGKAIVPDLKKLLFQREPSRPIQSD